MTLLYLITWLIFLPVQTIALFYAGFLYLIGLAFKSKKLKLYGRNIALGVWDQGTATILGQAPDISISEALGLAKYIHEYEDGYASSFVLFFGKVVDIIFCNKIWCIEKNHISNSFDYGETYKNTVTHWHYSVKNTNTRVIIRRDKNVDS